MKVNVKEVGEGGREGLPFVVHVFFRRHMTVT